MTIIAARAQNIEIAKGDERDPGAPPTANPEGEPVDQPGATKWPVVQFPHQDGLLLLPPMEFTVVNVYGVMEAKRLQVRSLGLLDDSLNLD